MLHKLERAIRPNASLQAAVDRCRKALKAAEQQVAVASAGGANANDAVRLIVAHNPYNKNCPRGPRQATSLQLCVCFLHPVCLNHVVQLR